MAILRVFYPDSNTRDYQLPPTHGQIFLIGRADNANLQFEHNPDFDFVSDYHAYIINQHGQYFICDGSPDGTPSIVGTFVNGKPISNQPYPLTPNDKITIGSSNFGIPIQFITNQTQPQYSQQLPYYGQHPSASYPMHHYNSVTVNGIQYQLAGFGTRLVAYIIDGIILSIISSVVVTIIWSLFGPNINNVLYNLDQYNNAIVRAQLFSYGISLLINAIYFIYFLTQRDGQTVGKSVMNIKIIKVNGAPLTTSDAILRNIVGYFISGFVLLLGFIWIAFDQDKQGWHDKIANTYVVHVPRQYYMPPPGNYGHPPHH